jgi:ParB family chromosome partitioning protein
MAKKPSLTDLLNANAQARSGSGANTETQTRLISVYDLAPNAGNFYDVSDIDALKQSIELIGLQQNLVVKPLGGGKYEVISGHRRRRACRILADEGKDEFRRVPCTISAADDPLLERLELIMTNSTTRQLSDWEQLRQARELRKILTELKERAGVSGRVRDLVAEVMNASAAKIGRLDAIDRNLAPAFKAEVERGNIRLTAAYELSGLSPDAQASAFDEYQTSGRVTVEQAKAKKQAETPPSAPAAPETTHKPSRSRFEIITASPEALAAWIAEYLQKIQACPNNACPHGLTPGKRYVNGECNECLIDALLRKFQQEVGDHD